MEHIGFHDFCRANQANYARKLEADAKSFRTEIERYEFLAVDWVDEYEAAVTRVDPAGLTAADLALRKCHTSVAATLQAAVERYAAQNRVFLWAVVFHLHVFCDLVFGFFIEIVRIPVYHAGSLYSQISWPFP